MIKDYIQDRGKRAEEGRMLILNSINFGELGRDFSIMSLFFISVLVAPSYANICPLDPVVPCCQKCHSRRVVCEVKIEEKEKEADLGSRIKCAQSEIDCQKICETKLREVKK